MFGWSGYDIHDEAMRTVFLDNAPSVWECNRVVVGAPAIISGNVVASYNTLLDAVNYAISHNYEIIIMPYAIMHNRKLEWETAYANGINVFIPYFDNSNDQHDVTSTMLEYAILCGAHNSTIVGNQSTASYGQGLEFVAITQNVSSESAACSIIAGKFATILSLDYDRYVSRQILRQVSTNIYNYSVLTGYGIPDLALISSIINIMPGTPCEISCVVHANDLVISWKANGNYDSLKIRVGAEITIDISPIDNLNTYTYHNESELSTPMQVYLRKIVNNIESEIPAYSVFDVVLSPFMLTSAAVTSLGIINLKFSKHYGYVPLNNIESNAVINAYNPVPLDSYDLEVNGLTTGDIPITITYGGSTFISDDDEALVPFTRFEVNSSFLAPKDPSIKEVLLISKLDVSIGISVQVDLGDASDCDVSILYGLITPSSQTDIISLTEDEVVPFLISGLTAGTTYYYQILLTRGYFELMSDIATFTTAVLIP